LKFKVLSRIVKWKLDSNTERIKVSEIIARVGKGQGVIYSNNFHDTISHLGAIGLPARTKQLGNQVESVSAVELKSFSDDQLLVLETPKELFAQITSDWAVNGNGDKIASITSPPLFLYVKGDLMILFHDKVDINSNFIPIHDRSLDYSSFVAMCEVVVSENFDYPSDDYFINNSGLFVKCETEISLDSSNDLLSHDAIPITWKLFAICVAFTQILSFGIIISQNYASQGFYSRKWEMVLIRILISCYLGMEAAGALSEASMTLLSRANRSWFFRGPTRHIARVFILLIFIPAAMISLVNLKRKRLEQVQVILDIFIVVLSVYACLLVTVQQTSALDSVFNFAGLLVIAQFDELIASTMSWKLKTTTIAPRLPESTSYELLPDVDEENTDAAIKGVEIDEYKMGPAIAVLIVSLVYLFTPSMAGTDNYIIE
jgi:hypothetical protein